MAQFDIFLAHNGADKALVREIAAALKERGINYWLDEEQIPPGTRWQDELQKAIADVKSAAIFIGPQGLGRWQQMELQTITSQFVEKGCPVIPVLLPGIDQIPEELIFLRTFHFVRFVSQLDETDVLDKLVWGITGQKPDESSHNPARIESYRKSRSNVSDLLPFLIDRWMQERALEELLLGQSLSQPTICLIYGDDTNCLDRFIDVVETVYLPKLLELGNETAPHKEHIRLPRAFTGKDQLFRDYLTTISDSVLGFRSASEAEISHSIASTFAREQVILLESQIYPSLWQQYGMDLVRYIVEF